MQFFVLGDLRTIDWNYHANASGMKPKHQADPPKCPVCGDYVGMLLWLPPYHAEITVHGRELGDIIKCAGMNLLVSDRLRRAWQDAGLRGIEMFSPVERIRVRPARLGRRTLSYYHVQPRYSGTRVDLEHSLIEYDRPITCHHCVNAGVDSVRGFTIDESSWTGEDLFVPWGLNGDIVVTDRVRQLRDEHGLTNMNLTPVEEYFIDFYKRWTPIDYSAYMPEDTDTPNDDADHDSTVLN